MNRYEIGLKFEKEAFAYLKNCFDKVIWLSENKKSVFDFKVERNGLTYYVEAKHMAKGKPILRKSQKDADFVITKQGGVTTLIPKESFKNKVLICKKEDGSSVRIKLDTNKLILEVQRILNKNSREKISIDTIIWVALQKELKRLERKGKSK